MVDLDLNGKGMTSQRTRDRLVARLARQGISNDEILAVLGTLPRHLFVDEALAHRAYEDSALPIGYGQTLSRPFIVALMTQTLLNVPRGRVLEIGTGTGYQTAVLAAMAGVSRVYTMERLASLAERAETRLRKLRCRSVRFRHGDGYLGWPGEAPFDGILLTAAPRRVPDALLEQLGIGGRLVAPVGAEDSQELRIYDKTAHGVETSTRNDVRFVPLVKGLR
jgi:protein-L-isoaspartate(D-aspartate) O-methyltransferase